MIDRGQNEKRRIEATIQTVAMAQELYAQAAPVEHAALRRAQVENAVVDAQLILKHAFFSDVGPALAGWRKANGLPADRLVEHRRTGYARAAAAERPRRLRALGPTPGGRFARHGAGPLGLQATAR